MGVFKEILYDMYSGFIQNKYKFNDILKSCGVCRDFLCFIDLYYSTIKKTVFNTLGVQTVKEFAI